MRHHFHRCQNLRVVSIDASDISGKRSGGSAILDELCQAKGLTRCVGLAECDILTDGQRRELLAVRVSELRERTGGASPTGDLGGARGREIVELCEELLAERAVILNENLRLLAEATAAFDNRADDATLGTAEDVALSDLSVKSPLFRMPRLDAIERALEEMSEERSRYGACARCGALIDVGRLRREPDTHVCKDCAASASPVA